MFKTKSLLVFLLAFLLPAYALASGIYNPGSSGGGSGVTSIGTSGPITGGPITTTGTIGCATCVTSAASLTSGKIITGSGSQATAVDASASLSSGALTLGASGTAGSVILGNATSGTITLQPVTGALGTVTVSIPAATDTLVNLTGTQTLTNKTLTSPILTGPTLGTPAQVNLSLGTNLPVSTGISGLASGMVTFLATPSSANLRSTVTDESGTGTLFFAGGNIGAAIGTSLAIGSTSAQTLLYVNGGAMASAPSTLTISTSTFTPVATGANTFRVVLIHASCPCTIAAPSGTAVDGTRIVIEVWQSATGSDTASWTTGSSGSYDFGTTGAPTLSTGASKGDFVGFSYSAQNSRWNYIGITQGM